jgi:hypothetical protein
VSVPAGMTSTRKSRSIFADMVPDARLRERYTRAGRNPAGDGRMFVEDVKNSLLPPPGHHPWRAEFTGPGGAQMTAWVSAGDPRGGDLTRAIHRVFQQAAGLLLTHDEAIYEIELLHQASQPSTISAVRLHLIPPGSYERRDTGPVQILPTEWVPGGAITLDPELLIEFHLDASMRRVLSELFIILPESGKADQRMAALIKSDLGPNTKPEVRKLITMKRRILLAATAQVGWNARELFSEDTLDPYSAWRYLQFLEFRIGLRDNLLGQVNTALQHLAPRIGLTTELTLINVPTREQLIQARDDLVSGRQTIREIIHFAITQENRTTERPSASGTPDLAELA